MSVLKDHGPRRVLSLTGGGYRGIFTLQVLIALLELLQYQEPLESTIDVFAGTSIGGILACGLAVGVPPATVLATITRHGRRIFDDPAAPALRRIVIGTLYDSQALRSAIAECLGEKANMPMRSVVRGLVIPAVDFTSGQIQVYRSGYFGAHAASDAALIDVCLATAAAPTYFAPANVNGTPMLDGGLVANNPDMVALTELIAKDPGQIKRFEMLSIGTAGTQTKYSAHDAEKSGLEWASAMPGFMIDLQERAASAQAAALLRQRYLRINYTAGAGPAFERLDLASHQATHDLLEAGLRTARQAFSDHRLFLDRFFNTRRLGAS